MSKIPLFEWLDGMSWLTVDGIRWRYISLANNGMPRFVHESFDYIWLVDETRYKPEPDTKDPATLRLILEIIRRHPGWEDADILQSKAMGVWMVVSDDHDAEGETEIDALKAALSQIESSKRTVGDE